MKCGKRCCLMLIITALLSTGFRTADTEIDDAVNIYLSDSIFYVSDAIQGIHVYSVSDPSAPRHKLTIPLVDNSGLAVKDSIIYANSGSSLLAIKLHDDSLYDVVSIIHNKYNYNKNQFFMGDGVSYGGWGCTGCMGPTSTDVSGTETGTGGMGGSYAIFSVIDTFLYYIDGQSIITLTISDPENPFELSQTYINWDIETMFPTEKYLFIGGQTGMYILDRSNPQKPATIGTFSHVTTCDPVVVQGTIAYVTLRSGGRCGRTTNALMVVDIADPTNPKLLKQVNMATPYGLTIKDSLLYVSNGSSGFSLYNVSQPSSPEPLGQWGSPSTKDFIWYGDNLFVMGFEDIRILSVSNPQAPVQISSID
ncbi:MAG: hypothetical protein GF401_00910 [Chitinivibrionales bacterium]|nr:hypothetical protein [Chitinivibrionales bacterium]